MATNNIQYAKILTIFICCSRFYFTHQEKVLGEENEDFDFDGLPGAQHEFKIDIPAGRQECFYQKVAEGATIHVSYEVLRGGDRLIDMFMYGPGNTMLQTHTYKSEGNMEIPAQTTGIYTLCIDNTISRISAKLVYVYIVTIVMDEWSKYVKEIEDLSAIVTNFTHAIREVQMSISEVKIHQVQSRMHVIKDWYLLTGNNKYVVQWSILQIVVVLATSIFTVYFVRRLFRIPNVTPSNKPRA